MPQHPDSDLQMASPSRDHSAFSARAYARGSDKGFILPLTLWIIAAIGLVVVAVNEWVGRAVDNARVLKERADIEMSIANIRAELVFAIGTRPMSYRGMEVGKLVEKIDRTDPSAMMASDFRTDRYVRMDGTPYKMQSDEDFVVRFYDGRGLVNLNSISAPYIRRMLGLYDVDENARNSMVDALEDYTDRDDLTRISGAEQRDYERLNRRAPANAWLNTPSEAQYVMGWDKVTDLWRRDLASPLVSTCRVTGFNPNTASREALLANFPDLTEEDIQAVLERRARRPFRNIREFASAAKTIVRDEPFYYTFAPGSCVIVEITHRPSGERSRFSLTIDNFSAKTRPWQIDYAFHIPRRPEEPATADREPPPERVFPAPDIMDADSRADPKDLDARPPGALDSDETDDATPGF